MESLVDEVKSEIRREMDQLNRRIDHIDKQLSTILQLLTAAAAGSSSAAVAGAQSLKSLAVAISEWV